METSPDPRQQNSDSGDSANLKLRTARTLKWNTIDRLSTQLLYALIGVVLAIRLPQADFGLVGAILVFQAFAILFVDSGFGSALLQLKHPTQQDYSTVFWFNFCVSVLVYAVLWFAAPGIAAIFQNQQELIPLSRAMFLTFVLTALSIVQTNRLMKRMEVKQIALANIVGLLISGATGIWMAYHGFGVWSLVWQTVLLSAVKSVWLWCTGRWVPTCWIRRESMKRIWRVGLGVFTSQFLNTLCLNIYSFIIGAFYNMTALGVYTQADKWSKMGSASLSQILTATFVPVLARFQDSMERYRAMMGKVNRFTAFVVFPVMGALIVIAEPLFHALFDTKWDAAIILFQILTARGVFVIYTSLFNNYLLALGHARSLVVVEVVKDVLLIGAIFATVWLKSVEALVWGQLAAGALTCLFTALIALRHSGYSAALFIRDAAPYVLLTLAVMAGAWLLVLVLSNPWLLMLSQLAGGAVLYCGVLSAFRSKVLADALDYLLGRFRRR